MFPTLDCHAGKCLNWYTETDRIVYGETGFVRKKSSFLPSLKNPGAIQENQHTWSALENALVEKYGPAATKTSFLLSKIDVAHKISKGEPLSFHEWALLTRRLHDIHLLHPYAAQALHSSQQYYLFTQSQQEVPKEHFTVPLSLPNDLRVLLPDGKTERFDLRMVAHKIVPLSLNKRLSKEDLARIDSAVCYALTEVQIHGNEITPEHLSIIVFSYLHALGYEITKPPCWKQVKAWMPELVGKSIDELPELDYGLWLEMGQMFYAPPALNTIPLLPQA